MLPFQTSFPQLSNQIRTDGSNNSAPQQVLLSNPCNANLSNLGSNQGHQFPCSSCACNNPLIHSHLFALNPQLQVPFNGSNAHLSNLNGNVGAIPNAHFLNVTNHYLPVQNTHMGIPHLGSSAHINKPHGQFFSQNTLQNLNPVATSQSHGHLQNFPQNLNKIAPSQLHGQLFMNNLSPVTNHTRPLQPHVCPSVQGGQFSSLNPQHMNQSTVLPQGQFSQHSISLPQVVPFNLPPCSHPSMGCLNQGSQTTGSQNSTFLMNPQLGMVNSNGVGQHDTQNQPMFITPALNQNTLQKSPITAQRMQSKLLPSPTDGPIQMQQTQKNMHPGTFQRSQGNPQGKNFTRTNNETRKRESAHPRFQKSKFHLMANAKGNCRPFNGKGGKGQCDEGAMSSHKQIKMEFRRSPCLNYPEQEIQQWRDERRKNYPSKSNIEKKMAEKQTCSDAVDEDGKKRRQQLKEILAKQAELGVEIAELPPNYLSESESRVCARENKMWTKKGRFQNKHGKRQKHWRDGRFVKKQKFDNDSSSIPALHDRKPTLLQQLLNSPPMPALHDRKPTLLQQLLSADIKRGKSHLLQVFRFMVMNSFFRDWPKKPLEFPTVAVKDVGCNSEIVREKSSPSQGNGGISEISEDSIVGKFVCPEDHNTTDDEGNGDDNDDDIGDADAEEMINGGCIGETDSIGEEIMESEGEEGEITD